jgi:polysaccharide export outer membrane protein
MTVQELEYHLKQLLEKDYLVNAQVLCFIEEYHPRQVSVIGEVNSPGKFELPEEKTMTLLEAIALAGGFTKDAKLETVKIMRVNQGQKETLTINVKDITDRGQKEDDVTLQPDDIIVVPESFF